LFMSSSIFPETAARTIEEVEGIFTHLSGSEYIGTFAWESRGLYRRAAKLEQTGVLERTGRS
jgi:hypothetical protein